MKSLLRRTAGVAVGCLCFAALISAVATASTRKTDDGDRHVLKGAKPSWTDAVAKTADVPAGEGIRAKVWLAPRNAAGLDALARAVSDPSSSQYQQFISEDAYRAQFAPTADQVAQVSAWLTSAGLHVDAVGADAHYLAVSGTAEAVNAAFGTELAKFVVNGELTQAPAVEVSVPSSVADSVATVTGLSPLGHKVQPADFGPPGGFVNGTPCSNYYGQRMADDQPKFQGHTLPYAPCGYTPSQYRGAYGVSGSNAGSGATVAITDAFDAPTLLSDANTYATKHGDQAFKSNQFRDRSVPEDASKEADCGGNGWYGEQTLDIEAVHGMAPDATVLYYGAASCYDDDLLAQLAQVVKDNKASVVTNSWGEPTFLVIDGVLYTTIDQGLIDAYESVFKQGAAQGIGFYFSSGDSGDNLDAWGYKHPDWPSGGVWVTSVGGTTLAIDRSNNRTFETGWGTQRYGLTADLKGWTLQVPFLYGAGGGFSQVFDQPWYQQGVAPSNTGRSVPDLAMDGDPTTGMLIGETQSYPLASRFGPAGVHYGEFRIGGTSLSSPLLAGAQAVAQGTRRIGFANPLIYSLVRNNSPFFDVTPQGDAGNVRADYVNAMNADGGYRYTVRTFDDDSSLKTERGWDDVTGVGSITPAYFSRVSGGSGR